MDLDVLIGELQTLGFVYGRPRDEWVRERDGASLSREAVETFARHYPELVPQLLRLLTVGSRVRMWRDDLGHTHLGAA